jgi:hypothetical protein
MPAWKDAKNGLVAVTEPLRPCSDSSSDHRNRQHRDS